jgi:Cu-Zn family superoxide dismutase
MKNILLAGSGVFLLAAKYNQRKANCNESFEQAALCILNPDGGSTAKGLVLFKQSSFEGPTSVEGKFSGLKKNAKHGFHIHELGDLTQGCATAGPHYNPFNKTHGGQDDPERHVGDLGNLETDENGNAHYKHNSPLISLSGKYSVVGRSCVVHADEDDHGRGNFPDSKTTGHSGARIACGVIALCAKDKKI